MIQILALHHDSVSRYLSLGSQLWKILYFLREVLELKKHILSNVRHEGELALYLIESQGGKGPVHLNFNTKFPSAAAGNCRDITGTQRGFIIEAATHP